MVLASPSATIMLYFKSVAHSKIMKSYTYYLSWFRFGRVCVCVCQLKVDFLDFCCCFFPYRSFILYSCRQVPFMREPYNVFVFSNDLPKEDVLQ